MQKFLYWTPRVLSILLVGFISLFALDVFGEYTGWELVVALVMHLLPTIVAIIFIIVAWKWEQIGGWLFVGLGLVFLWIVSFQLMGILTIALPFALIGGMFLVHYYKYLKKQTSPVPEGNH